MSRLRFSPQALIDYEDAATWYRQRNPTAASRFRREMNDCIRRILASPRLAALTPEGTRRALLRSFPYVLHYAEVKDGIVIIAIVHAHRHPDAWRRAVDAEVHAD